MYRVSLIMYRVEYRDSLKLPGESSTDRFCTISWDENSCNVESIISIIQCTINIYKLVKSMYR